jgi:membrane-bound lytic murein transglycosylase D
VVVVKRATEQRRVERAASPAYWRSKVATHGMPARAADLAPRLQRIFREEGLPEALVWTAEVESTMNPAARSPAGAVGLFQLMPATARSLGLKTANPDQRLDPEANARAAARYFKRLRSRFGSWQLVLAAYNCGEGRVAKALKQADSRDYAAIAARLPLETRMYVPRVLETIRLRAGGALED